MWKCQGTQLKDAIVRSIRLLLGSTREVRRSTWVMKAHRSCRKACAGRLCRKEDQSDRETGTVTLQSGKHAMRVTVGKYTIKWKGWSTRTKGNGFHKEQGKGVLLNIYQYSGYDVIFKIRLQMMNRKHFKLRSVETTSIKAHTLYL